MNEPLLPVGRFARLWRVLRHVRREQVERDELGKLDRRKSHP